ncbi:MAG: hypothetical protein L0Y55_16375 [Anaerolineales bacterium]|nr:hypothetical protein [Anaerolineales bacterium]
MQVKKIFWFAILCALGLFASNAMPAWACEPEGDNLANGAKDPRCRMVLPAARALPAPRAALASAGNPVIGPVDYSASPMCFLPDGSLATNALGIGEDCPPPFLPPRAVKTPAPAIAATASVTATVVAKATPKGDSPHSARTMNGEWETIPSGGQVWYRINNENNFYLDLWMDTYGRPGVVFSVYSPEQINNLSVNTAPKGRSSTAKSDPSHDWWWKGAQANGIWHVLVLNTTSTPMQYRIHYKQNTEDRVCKSYWEWLSTGQYVYWTACR